MAARTSGKQVPYKVLHNLSTIDLLYGGERKKGLPLKLISEDIRHFGFDHNFQVVFTFCTSFNFGAKNRFFAIARRPGMSLYTIEHCWFRTKTNMAAVWKTLERFCSMFSFPCVLKMALNL